MQHLDIHKKRIRQFQQRAHEKRYVPFAGLTDAPRTPGDPTGKRRIPLITTAKGGEAVDEAQRCGKWTAFQRLCLEFHRGTRSL